MKYFITSIPLYDALVQGMNGAPVSLSYDAFSYGMVMYELFSYQLPFAEVSSLLVPNKILEGDVRNSNEYSKKPYGLCKYKCTNMMLCLLVFDLLLFK